MSPSFVCILASVLGAAQSAVAYKPTQRDEDVKGVIVTNANSVSGCGVFMFANSWDLRSGGYRMVLFRMELTFNGAVDPNRPVEVGLLWSKGIGKCYFFEKVSDEIVYLCDCGTFS